MTTIRHDDKVYYADVSVPGVEGNHGQGCCQRDLHTTHTLDRNWLMRESSFSLNRSKGGSSAGQSLSNTRTLLFSSVHGGKGFNSARQAEPNSTLHYSIHDVIINEPSHFSVQISVSILLISLSILFNQNKTDNFAQLLVVTVVLIMNLL